MEVDVHTPELVATGFDGSPAGVAALAWAATEATAHRRQLCVYHCWQQPVLAAATVPPHVRKSLTVKSSPMWRRM